MIPLEKSNGDIITRIDTRLNNEIKDIKRIRAEAGFNGMNNSDRLISSLIVRHNLWSKVKKDIINFGVENE